MSNILISLSVYEVAVMDRLFIFALLIHLKMSLVFISCNSMNSVSPQKVKKIRSAIIVDDELYEKMVDKKSFRGKNIDSEIATIYL